MRFYMKSKGTNLWFKRENKNQKFRIWVNNWRKRAKKHRKASKKSSRSKHSLLRSKSSLKGSQTPHSWKNRKKWNNLMICKKALHILHSGRSLIVTRTFTLHNRNQKNLIQKATAIVKLHCIKPCSWILIPKSLPSWTQSLKTCSRSRARKGVTRNRFWQSGDQTEMEPNTIELSPQHP